MAINGVLRPGHVAIRVREMEPAVKHYTEVLGLIETARELDTLSLAAYLGHKQVQNTKRYAKMNSTRFDGLWKD